MNIKNYTSSVPADRSVSRIEDVLVSMGATNIAKEYKEGRLDSIQFVIIKNGTSIPFKLPARVDAIEKHMRGAVRRPRPDTFKHIKDQAQRTAWKLICEWVEVQASIIKLEQAEFLEVFLPYVYQINDGQTFFEKIKEKNYKALLN